MKNKSTHKSDLEQEEMLNVREQNNSEENDPENEDQENSVEEELEKVSEDPLDKLIAELDESKDKYLRLYSEFENFRRRTIKEKQILISSATEDLMAALVPVLDDFERADNSLAGDEQATTSIKEGIDLVYQKFRKTLEQKGLMVMDAKPGSEFDPELHEAITQIPIEDKKLKGKIVDVVEKGYTLKDKVIRYAKVVVGS